MPQISFSHSTCTVSPLTLLCTLKLSFPCSFTDTAVLSEQTCLDLLKASYSVNSSQLKGRGSERVFKRTPARWPKPVREYPRSEPIVLKHMHTPTHTPGESANFTLTELQGNGHGCSQASSARWLALRNNMAFCARTHACGCLRFTQTHPLLMTFRLYLTLLSLRGFFGISTLNRVSARLPSCRQLSVKLGKCHPCLSYLFDSERAIACRLRLRQRASGTSERNAYMLSSVPQHAKAFCRPNGEALKTWMKPCRRRRLSLPKVFRQVSRRINLFNS